MRIIFNYEVITLVTFNIRNSNQNVRETLLAYQIKNDGIHGTCRTHEEIPRGRKHLRDLSIDGRLFELN
jgi:hypothetical protein